MVTSPIVVTVAIRTPRHDDRERDRQLDAPEALAGREAHPRRGLDHLGGTPRSPVTMLRTRITSV